MQSSARVFNCARCRCPVVICSHCDRGNLYCGKRCSETARRQSRREASERYQKTRRGRRAHAERQRRYRQRRRKKVTHQGSPPPIPDETLPAESRASPRRSEVPAAVAGEGILLLLIPREHDQPARRAAAQHMLDEGLPERTGAAGDENR